MNFLIRMKLRNGIFGLIVFLLFISCKKKTTGPETDLTFDEKLFGIPELTVTEIPPQNGYPRQFEIYISQPLDHNNPGGITFNQQLFLSHKDETAPVVLMPSGYATRATTVAEISELLDANQIYVGHRFIGNSSPTIREWDYLTVEQAAADFHHVVELFKTIYSGKWLSYGASKNGITALYHRRFYPDDVDATLTQVAPISFAPEDPRYDTFLENVGDQAIRDKIKRFQIDLLEHREEILPLMKDYMDNSSLTFSIPEGAVLEFETLEYGFSFWQYGVNDISTVPDTGLTALQLFNIIEGCNYLPYYSDVYIDYMEPYYYQIYTELGYYRLVDEHVSHLLVDLPDPSYSYFAPSGVPLNFNPAIMQDLDNWLQTEGNNIIYIYGEIDPWTAGAIESTGSTNAVKIIQPGANHSILIENLDQKELIYNTLENWLDIPIQRGANVLSKQPDHREIQPPLTYCRSFYLH